MWTVYPDGSVRRASDGAVILPDINSDLPAQRDYQAILDGGGEPDPTLPVPTPPRQQLGGTFLAAIADLGWWIWFDQGATTQAAAAPNGAGKPLDERYWLSIGKADLVLVTDAKLTRVARAAEAARVAASSQAAPSAPLITLAAVMDHGDAMTKTNP